MSDELNATLLAELKALLEKAEEDITQGLSDSTASAIPVELGVPLVHLTGFDALQQQHGDITRHQEFALQLRQIRAALSQIEGGRGTYGPCIQCGGPIGFARLKARPENPLCTGCQRVTGSG
jgi:DnaK suppressor protein